MTSQDLLEHRPTLHIASTIQVWHRYAVEIGSNYASQPDAQQALWIAPEVKGEGVEWLYLTTNGDPVVVGWLDGEEVDWSDDAKEWMDNPENAWIERAIQDNLLQG